MIIILFLLGRDSSKIQTGGKKRKSTISDHLMETVSQTSNIIIAKNQFRNNADAADLTSYSKPELQRATSTTTMTEGSYQLASPSSTSSKTFNPLSDPADWSVDDVMRYLISVDSVLSSHTELFQKHVMSTINF